MPEYLNPYDGVATVGESVGRPALFIGHRYEDPTVIVAARDLDELDGWVDLLRDKVIDAQAERLADKAGYQTGDPLREPFIAGYRDMRHGEDTEDVDPAWFSDAFPEAVASTGDSEVEHTYREGGQAS